MDPFAGWGIDDIFQVLVVLLFIGAPIVRAIFNAFIGPVKKAAERRASSDAPPPQLRDFLEEVRKERESRQAPGRPSGEEPPEGFGPWENIPDEPATPRNEDAPARVEAPRAEARPPAPARQRLPDAPLPDVLGAPEPGPSGDREAAARKPLSRRLEDRKLSRVATRHIHSRLEDRELDASVEDRQLQDRLSKSLEAKFGPVKRGRRTISKDIPGLPHGVGLREAMLLQAIFGPPRARQRHVRHRPIRPR